MIPDIWLQTRGTWNAVEEFETLSLRPRTMVCGEQQLELCYSSLAVNRVRPRRYSRLRPFFLFP
jgi:hypothetical protein